MEGLPKEPSEKSLLVHAVLKIKSLLQTFLLKKDNWSAKETKSKLSCMRQGKELAWY